MGRCGDVVLSVIQITNFALWPASRTRQALPILGFAGLATCGHTSPVGHTGRYVTGWYIPENGLMLFQSAPNVEFKFRSDFGHPFALLTIELLIHPNHCNSCRWLTSRCHQRPVALIPTKQTKLNRLPLLLRLPLLPLVLPMIHQNRNP